MTPHEINILIERYLDGETTLAEERELALAVQQEDRPAEWAIIAEMLSELTADEAIYDEIMAQREPKPVKHIMKFWPWAAAACIAIVFGLSYNILIEEPQETAKVETPPSVQPKPEDKPFTEPLLASHPKPPTQKPPLQIKQPPVEEPFDDVYVEEPLLEPQPQFTAEVEDLPPSEELALYMALLAEVEARTLMLQNEQTPLLDGAEENAMQQLLLDELLANIQQLSNRPELSL